MNCFAIGKQQCIYSGVSRPVRVAKGGFVWLPDRYLDTGKPTIGSPLRSAAVLL